jgi:hypothetical protein
MSARDAVCGGEGRVRGANIPIRPAIHDPVFLRSVDRGPDIEVFFEAFLSVFLAHRGPYWPHPGKRAGSVWRGFKGLRGGVGAVVLGFESYTAHHSLIPLKGSAPAARGSSPPGDSSRRDRSGHRRSAFARDLSLLPYTTPSGHDGAFTRATHPQPFTCPEL